MDKTIIGILGGVSALALVGGTQTASSVSAPPAGIEPARSFADLLEPISNPVEVLRAENQRAVSDASSADVEANVELAQYYHHHHHHHHHYYYYRRYHDHHHYYHHHHHHHHHYYY